MPIKKSTITAVTVMSRLFFMRKVTALSYQKNNADRVNVYLDGEFAFGLAEVVAIRLSVGQELSPDEIESLQEEDDYEKAKKNALSLIARRPRSISEIERHLRNKGFSELVIEQVANRLQELDLLNDSAFADYWVEQRETFRPRSKLALQQELQQKGLSRSVIDAAVDQVDEQSSAMRIAEKQANKWAYLSEEEFKVKLGRFLQRRGFPYDVIETTINKIWDGLEREEEID